MSWTACGYATPTAKPTHWHTKVNRVTSGIAFSAAVYSSLSIALALLWPRHTPQQARRRRGTGRRRRKEGEGGSNTLPCFCFCFRLFWRLCFSCLTGVSTVDEWRLHHSIFTRPCGSFLPCVCSHQGCSFFSALLFPRSNLWLPSTMKVASTLLAVVALITAATAQQQCGPDSEGLSPAPIVLLLFALSFFLCVCVCERRFGSSNIVACFIDWPLCCGCFSFHNGGGW